MLRALVFALALLAGRKSGPRTASTGEARRMPFSAPTASAPSPPARAQAPDATVPARAAPLWTRPASVDLVIGRSRRRCPRLAAQQRAVARALQAPARRAHGRSERPPRRCASMTSSRAAPTSRRCSRQRNRRPGCPGARTGDVKAVTSALSSAPSTRRRP